MMRSRKKSKMTGILVLIGAIAVGVWQSAKIKETVSKVLPSKSV
jgi:hypothetical protein